MFHLHAEYCQRSRLSSIEFEELNAPIYCNTHTVKGYYYTITRVVTFTRNF